jgi:hypothetical protein
MFISLPSHQSLNAWAINSGRCSQRMFLGLPFSHMIFSRTLMTRFAGNGHRYLLRHGNLAGIIHDVKNAELPSALNPVTDKINGPGNIGLFGHNQRVLNPWGKRFFNRLRFS